MGDNITVGPILLGIEKYDEIAAHIQAIDRLLVKTESED